MIFPEGGFHYAKGIYTNRAISGHCHYRCSDGRFDAEFTCGQTTGHISQLHGEQPQPVLGMGHVCRRK